MRFQAHVRDGGDAVVALVDMLGGLQCRCHIALLVVTKRLGPLAGRSCGPGQVLFVDPVGLGFVGDLDRPYTILGLLGCVGGDRSDDRSVPAEFLAGTVEDVHGSDAGSLFGVGSVNALDHRSTALERQQPREQRAGGVDVCGVLGVAGGLFDAVNPRVVTPDQGVVRTFFPGNFAFCHGSLAPFRDLQGTCRDALVGTAAADVAAQPLLDVCERRLGVLVEESPGGDHEAGSAETALHRVVLDESGDDLVDLLAPPQRLDGANLLALALDRQPTARQDRLAVDHHRVSAVGGPLVHLLAAGQVQVVPKDVQQRHSRLDLDRVILAVDVQRHVLGGRGEDVGLQVCGCRFLGTLRGHRRGGGGRSRSLQEVATIEARSAAILIVSIPHGLQSPQDVSNCGLASEPPDSATHPTGGDPGSQTSDEKKPPDPRSSSRTSLTNIQPGACVMANGTAASSSTACGVTPQAQKSGNSFLSTGTASP